MRYASLISWVFSLSVIAGLFLLSGADAQSAVIDEEGLEYDKEEPAYTDDLTVTVPVVFVDSEPVDDGVVLKWKLCTDVGCELPTKTPMTDNGDGTYSATIGGPFPREDASGNAYVDVGFTVEVTYVPTGGGEESTISTDEITVYFNEENTTPTDDDDDGQNKDEGEDEKDSPLAAEVVILGAVVMIFAGILIGNRKRA